MYYYILLHIIGPWHTCTKTMPTEMWWKWWHLKKGHFIRMAVNRWTKGLRSCLFGNFKALFYIFQPAIIRNTAPRLGALNLPLIFTILFYQSKGKETCLLYQSKITYLMNWIWTPFLIQKHSQDFMIFWIISIWWPSPIWKLYWY